MPQTDQRHVEASPRRELPTEILTPSDQKHRPPSVTIGKTPAEVFAFVKEFENYPKFMRGLKDVTVLAAKVAHLSFAHEGTVDNCDIEKLAEVKDQLVVWKTLGTSSLDHTGAFTIEPAPGNRGTVVSLKMSFDVPTPSKVRGMISYFLGRDPKNEAYINLRRLKAYLETGEVPTIQGQPSGRDQ